MKNRKPEKYIYAFVGVICIIIVGNCVFQWKEKKVSSIQTLNKLKDKVDIENQKAMKAKGNEILKIEETEEDQKTVKIRVLITNAKDDSYYHEHVVLQSNGKMVNLTTNQEFKENQKVSVCELSDVSCIFSGEERISLLSNEKNGRIPSYEGNLEIYKDQKGYYLINEIDIETYLKYVVPSEMPAGYPQEALKAQAVCARTYALKQIEEGRLKDFPAHVDDTVSYQVYNQIDPQESTNQAVEETAHKVIQHNGELIQAYFFSTSCGFTSTEQVWSGEEKENYLQSISVSKQTVEALANGNLGKLPDLSSQKDFSMYIRNIHELDYENEESWYRWKVRFPWEEISRRASENQWQLGELQEIIIKERTSGGAVYLIHFVGTQGEMELSNEYKIREFFAPKGFTMHMNGNIEQKGGSLLPSAYMDLEIVLDDGEKYVQIYGGGYGHGVGMSQNGAKEMAKDGLIWEEILKIFYKNVEITSISNLADKNKR